MLGIIAAVALGASAVSSIVGGQKASKAAKGAAAEEARLEGLVTQEKIRNLKIQERVMRGETIAGYAGGGVRVDVGSPTTILSEQASTFARERGITAQVGASRASQSLTRGEMMADQYKFSSYSSAASSLASMFGSISNTQWYQKNWGNSAMPQGRAGGYSGGGYPGPPT
jgi:hypothetical protein